MIPSRTLYRAAWKTPFFPPFANMAEHRRTNTAIRTNERSATIIPAFVGLKFLIHNGKTYHPLTVTDEMIGHKLGEFAHTRKAFSFRQTKNKGK